MLPYRERPKRTTGGSSKDLLWVYDENYKIRSIFFKTTGTHVTSVKRMPPIVMIEKLVPKLGCEW